MGWFVKAERFAEILNKDFWPSRGVRARNSPNGYLIDPMGITLYVYKGGLAKKEDVDVIISSLNISVDRFWLEYCTRLSSTYIR
jgi:hypothetical protein